MKVAFIRSRNRWYFPALLTRWFTGCGVFHVGFYSEETGSFYDMNVTRRKIKFFKSYLKDYKDYTLYPCRVTERYLEQKIETNQDKYSYIDYILFFFRWLGFKVKDNKGLVCSEMVNEDLRQFNVDTPWPADAPPPSPCDLLNWFKEKYDIPKT